MLKSQDIFILLKLIAIGPRPWAYAPLSVELFMSPSQVHAGIKRALEARLAIRQEDKISPNIRNLKEFLIHGLKYVFVPERGELVRGIPTGYAAPPLNKLMSAGASEPPPVWPLPEGEMRGIAFSPLCRHAPEAAMADENLFELLALIDAIRGGRVREQKIAISEIDKRLEHYAQINQS